MGKLPVVIKSNKYGLTVRLSDELPFAELLEAVGEKFRDSANFFKDAKMAVTFQGRVLTKDQENRLVDTIVMNSQLHVVCIVDERPEEEVYYEKALRLAEEMDTKDGQFYRGNLRGGQSLESDTSIVILGDVHPGASVTSKGNVVVLGACRGNVYAGASGDRDCFVAALVMKPVQIRIADKMARSAITKRTDNVEYALDPKIAFVKEDHIYVKNLVQSTVKEILGNQSESLDKNT
ncbi:MAG: septum site-determining protein MinC [Eubacteriales bacterium]|nr:septum site-determining protein MinC [Eubacteriales bacterium]